MESIRVISTSTVQAPSQDGDHYSTHQTLHLTPWDLYFLPIESIQKGLLFHNPTEQQDISTKIQHLKHSFSTTLAFFPTLTGRLSITTHHEDDDLCCLDTTIVPVPNTDMGTSSCYILCNNAGALFVHAIAENTRVSDILKPDYVPHIVYSFFPLNNVQNHHGTSQPLLAVQVTELVDGIFIGCTLNHVAGDGGSFWHFVNSWAEISRGHEKPSKLPSLENFFLDGIEPPIRFPLTKEDLEIPKPQQVPPERYFNFTKEKILKLKAKANEEVGTNNKMISSLQALLSHFWRSVIRCKGVDLQEDVSFIMVVGVRTRMVPPLPEDYFGNAVIVDIVTLRAGEVLEGRVGKVSWEMNKMISSYSNEKIRSHYESWVKTPTMFKPGGSGKANSNILGFTGSPRFDVYGNDFGWGKPLAVRSGSANKNNGRICVFPGVEEGSIDIEVCFPYDILDALGDDPEFIIDATSV